jgi:hypothetical protein
VSLFEPSLSGQSLRGGLFPGRHSSLGRFSWCYLSLQASALRGSLSLGVSGQCLFGDVSLGGLLQPFFGNVFIESNISLKSSISLEMFLSKGPFHSDSLSLGISLARKYLSKGHIKKHLLGDVSLWALFGGCMS